LFNILKIAKVLYNTDIGIEIISVEIINGYSDGVFKLTFNNVGFNWSSSKELIIDPDSKNQNVINSQLFLDLFPFHVIFKKNLQIKSMGAALKSSIKGFSGEFMTSIFNLEKPLIDFTWEKVGIKN